MDSMTHIYFAARLLTVAQQDQQAVSCALFPQIDRQPAYYHRLYAHSIAKAAPITEASRYAYWTSTTAIDESDYFQARLRKDRDRIFRYVSKSPYNTADHGAPPSNLAMYLAFISHLYNDQFNNPIQAFVPFSVYPSGAWALWESIDSAEFRWYLYERTSIDDLREETFAGPEWRATNTAEALIAGMISRLAKACPVKIERGAVESAMHSVGVLQAVGTREHREAEKLLEEHDGRIQTLIRKFSRPRDFGKLRRWAGEGY